MGIGSSSLSPEKLDTMLEGSEYLEQQLDKKASTDQTVSKDDWNQRNLQVVEYNAGTWSFPGSISATGTISGSGGPPAPSPPTPAPPPTCATDMTTKYPTQKCVDLNGHAIPTQSFYDQFPTESSSIPQVASDWKNKGPLIGNWWYPYTGAVLKDGTCDKQQWPYTGAAAPVFGTAELDAYVCAYNTVHKTTLPPTGTATLNLASGGTPTGWTGTGPVPDAKALITDTGQPFVGYFQSDCSLQCMSSDQYKEYQAIKDPISVLNIGGWGGSSGLFWNDKDRAAIQTAIDKPGFATFMTNAHYNGVSLDIEIANGPAPDDSGLTPSRVGNIFKTLKKKGYTTILTVPGNGPSNNNKTYPFMDNWITDPTTADITPHVDYLCIMFYSQNNDSCGFTPETMKKIITELWSQRLGFVPKQIILGLSSQSYQETYDFVNATKEVATGGMTRWYEFCKDKTPNNCLTKESSGCYSAWLPSCTTSTYTGTLPDQSKMCHEQHKTVPVSCQQKGKGTYTVKPNDGCYNIANTLCSGCGNNYASILCDKDKGTSCDSTPLQAGDTFTYDCSRTSCPNKV